MLVPGTILRDTYTIVSLIKAGGMGAVYSAKHKRLGSTVAVKEVKEKFLDDPLLLRAFEREARLLAGLRHPALPKVIDHFREGDGWFFVMEFIAGDDLGDMLKKRGRAFPVSLVMDWGDQLLGALEYLHKQAPPVIHRDIKPQNLKLTEDGQIVLLDFGLAKGQAEGMSRITAGQSLRACTLEYAPFEQIQGVGTDARSDLYSLAATLYHLMTGFAPADALSRAAVVVTGQPDPLQSTNALNVQVPQRVADVLMQAMSQNRDQRPAGAPEMRKMLRDAADAGHEQPAVVAPVAPQTGATIAMASERQKDNDSTIINRPSGNTTERKASRTKSLDFAVVTVDSKGNIKLRRQGQARYFVEELAGGITLEMVEIPGGTFTMGSPANEGSRSDDEGPPHQVTTAGFYMGKVEVTQAQWRAVTSLPRVSRKLNPDPSMFKGDNLPVEQVSWEDAMEFCARLSLVTGSTYRLPSEAEWEYACRAETETAFAFGETVTPESVNYNGNYPYGSAAKGIHRETTTAAGSIGYPNAFGLYDMHGNVWEWCLDYWHESYNGGPTNGSSWQSDRDASRRVLRGGSWANGAYNCRSASRLRLTPDIRGSHIGFRVVVGARTP